MSSGTPSARQRLRRLLDSATRTVAPRRVATRPVATRPVATHTATPCAATPLALESLEDRTLLAVLTVTASADSGVGSLRNAIESANASAGADTIVFDIPGTPGAVRTINLGSALPEITDTLTIDGTTQAGWTGAPLIELNGTSAGSGIAGLVIQADGSAVRGLVINRFTGHGIAIDGADNVTIRQNYIGLNNAGTVDLGNSAIGIHINNSSNVTVGGGLASDANVIAGNDAAGIFISGPLATGHVISNNLIGTTFTGNTGIPGGAGILADSSTGLVIRNNVIAASNSVGLSLTASTAATIAGNRIGTNIGGAVAVPNGSGIAISQSTNITIGGEDASSRNIISGNQADAIDIVDSSAVQILNNYIGTTGTGFDPLGNGGSGVTFLNVTNSTVGPGNVIVNNSTGVFIAGQTSSNITVVNNRIGIDADDDVSGNSLNVLIQDSSNNTITDNQIAGGNFGIIVQDLSQPALTNVFRRNTIYNLDSQAIDLGLDGANFNDNDDTDNGANGLQNSPTITDVKIVGSTVTFTGTLSSKPSTNYTLDFFLSPTSFGNFLAASPRGGTAEGLPIGGGQGRFYIGSVNITTDASGNASFNVAFDDVSVPINAEASATATGPEGTSEFSAPFDVDDLQLNVVANNLSALEDVALTNIIVATISDPVGGSASDEFTVIINWGDGTTSQGSVSGLGNGLFQVRGSHTYTTPGTFVLTVNVEHDDERTASDTASVTVSPSVIIGNGRDISAAPGQSFINRILATFIDSDPTSVPSDFTVTIEWGDKSEPSTGTLAKNAAGVFIVRGSHSYATAGEYDIEVTIQHESGRTVTATGTAVVEQVTIEPRGIRFAAVAGLRSGNVRVALFDDPVAGPQAPLSDYTASINWGNGRTSLGTVQRRSDGLLQVRGRNLYRAEGNFAVTVTLNHKDGRSTQASSDARVVSAPILPLTQLVKTLRRSRQTGRVAMFLDSNLFHAADDFSVLIRWGDGQASAGSVRRLRPGIFDISGAHTYSAPGSYTVRVELQTPDGQVEHMAARIIVRNASVKV